jgi:hypothetical protein
MMLLKILHYRSAPTVEAQNFPIAPVLIAAIIKAGR